MENWTCSECGRTISVVKLHYPVYCPCGIRHLRNGTKEPIVKIPSTNRTYSEDEIQNKLRRSREEFAGLQQRRAEGNHAWKVLHCREPEGEHDEQTELKWLQHEWEPLIPRFGCSCYDFYSDYKTAHQPCFKTPEDRFRWGFDLHNAVNNKLSAPLWTYERAIAYWRPHRYWGNQPRIDGVAAVTSISPLEAHRHTQEECIRSWQSFGLKVISGNLPQEIPELSRRFPSVEFRPVEASRLFDRPTPRIRDLMRLGGNRPILLLNSDIAIYGPQQWLFDALETRTAIAGVRHNWTEHPGDAEQEFWGLDAFLLFPEQIESFPLLDLGIGQPVWDYWVAFHLQSMNFDVRCLDDRLFFHRKHVLNWNSEMTNPGIAELESHYGKGDWNKWRRAFGEGKRELHREKKLCSIGPITVKNAR